MMNKLTIWLVLLLMVNATLWGQQKYSLDEVMDLMEKNYPLVNQSEVYDSIMAYQNQINNKSWLPQIALNGQATYQSQVTGVAVDIPGVTFTPVPKNQYRITLDAQQTIYDGGVTKAQNLLAQSSNQLSTTQNKVNIYSAKQQVLNIILNYRLQSITKAIYQSRLSSLLDLQDKSKSMVENNVLLSAALLEIDNQVLDIQQKITECSYAAQSLLDQLSILCGQDFNEHTEFSIGNEDLSDPENHRLEFQLFDVQKNQIAAQNAMVDAQVKPKVYLFAQGGLGRPGLNYLASTSQFYYIGGIKFTVPLSGLYAYKLQKHQNDLMKQNLDAQSLLLQQNIDLQLEQSDNNADMYQEFLQSDDLKISNAEQVYKVYKAQYEASTITFDECNRKLNDITQQKLARAIHLTQLEYQKLNKQYILGNL